MTVTYAPRDGFDATYLSFGGGVQSTALLAMCVLGERGFPRPDFAVYADTQSELPDTDQHVALMAAWALERGVRLVVSTQGSLEKVLLGEETSRRSGFNVSIPAFVAPTGGMLRRQCTPFYKLEVIRRAVRTELGFAKGEVMAGKVKVRALIGISYDEAQRMKTNTDTWCENTYPLVDARMTRIDCMETIKRLGLPEPKKSACVFCPYHDDQYWSWLKRERPEAFERACKVDDRIRTTSDEATTERPAVFTNTHTAYLHRSLRPLRELPLAPKVDHQLRFFKDVVDGFGNECEGLCGV